MFAAPHFYWAVGGRRGLGAETAAADEALGQAWFFAYNLVTGLLALAASAMAIMLARRAGRADRLTRAIRALAWTACGMLTVRGVVGLSCLALQAARGTVDSPALLIAFEPWFVVGGALFGILAARSRPPRAPAAA